MLEISCMQEANEQIERSFTDVYKLLGYLNLTPDKVNYHPDAHQVFKFLVPGSFVRRMQKGEPLDPLLLQVLPQYNESLDYEGFELDPLSESITITSDGIMQKYQHRLLLMPTSACGIHCRYCFRRHFPYQDTKFDLKGMEQQFEAIKQDKNITEVILSGGDPLTLNDDKLEKVLGKLYLIKHLKRLRIHTRQLIVEPERITQQFIKFLKQSPLPIAIVLHCNHPNEINQEVSNRLAQLKLSTIQLLNQSVLLKGVNDDSKILIKLSEKLYQTGILPYYLHQLDPVAGSQHFFVEDQKALALLQQLQTHLPGYLVPKLVKEKAGAKYKLSLSTPVSVS